MALYSYQLLLKQVNWFKSLNGYTHANYGDLISLLFLRIVTYKTGYLVLPEAIALSLKLTYYRKLT
jgi:hypothetical protein